MQTIMARFIKDESGATAIEYGLLAALIGVDIVAGATTVGEQLNSGFTKTGGTLTTANGKYPASGG